MRKILNFFLTAVFVFVVALGTPAPAKADPDPNLYVYLHIDSAFWPYRDTWGQRWYGYVDELNRFLAPTNKHLIYAEPYNVFLHDTEPFDFRTTGCTYDSPYTRGILFWFSSTGGRYGDPAVQGYSLGRDCSGYDTIVVNGMNLHNYLGNAIPDADYSANNPGTPQYAEYWRIITTILHEYAHSNSADLAEGYWFKNVNDPTFPASPPNASIDYNNPNDLWWSGTYYGGGTTQHPWMRWDPTANPPLQDNSISERALLAYSPLTIRFINDEPIQYTVNGYTDMTARINNLTVTQLTGGYGSPHAPAGITIKAWYLGNGPQPLTTVIGTYLTDSDGHVHVPWDSTYYAHHFPNSSMILLKSYTPGGAQYGYPEIIDAYNLDQFALDNTVATEYPVLMQGLPNPTVDAPSVAANSGRLVESAQGSGVGGSHNETIFNVGDTAARQGIRSVVEFDTSSLPDNAVIDSAILNMTVESVSGNIWDLGPSSNINVRIGVPCIGLCQVQNGDWQQTGVVAVGQMGPIQGCQYCRMEPYQHLTLTAGLANINKTGMTEFRLQYAQATDADGTSDKVTFYLPESAYPPTLTVNYHLP